jgi:alpha-tubulin suppressor-like RCC1 family protein
MATNFQINGKSFDDFFIPRDLFSQGGLWTWGNNNNGDLGDNTSVNKSSPIQTVAGGTNWKQVETSEVCVAAIKTDGTLWLWGYNGLATLGDNTTTNRSSPVQTVSGGTNWKQVACGQYHTAAIKTDGTLWLWGYNGGGRLGDNTEVDKSSPVQTVAAGTYWKQVSCGFTHTAAIKTDGSLWLWGANAVGNLGDNTITPKSSPIQTISGGTNWKQVACGNYVTAAIKTDGSLWLWGLADQGQLGNNSIADKSSPVQTVSGGTNWKQVSLGYHTAAIKTDGTLWLWGGGGIGELGNNDILNKSSPVQTVAAGTNWKQVAAGQYHTAAIKTDGTLWLWGDNIAGNLGDNTQDRRSSPVQTVAGGTNWKQVAIKKNAAAIREDFY